MGFDIYEEGFEVTGSRGFAHYVGRGYGDTFLDACREFIQRTGCGEIRVECDGCEYACDWGCRWFPSLAEAQRSFG
jgi:hypothetical protein